MKRILILAALLAGCAPNTKDPQAKEKALSPVLFTDSVTGCDYLSTTDLKTLTPRIAADGKTQMGCKAVQP